MKYVYPAIFYKDKELPETYSVIFPDVEGAMTQGKTLYEAIEMAEDSLSMAMVLYEDHLSGELNPPLKNRITEPTPIKDIVVEPDEFSSEAFVTLIKADTDEYRKQLAEMPPVDESDRENEDWEVPNTLAREICRTAGIPFPIEAKNE